MSQQHAIQMVAHVCVWCCLRLYTHDSGSCAVPLCLRFTVSCRRRSHSENVPLFTSYQMFIKRWLVYANPHRSKCAPVLVWNFFARVSVSQNLNLKCRHCLFLRFIELHSICSSSLFIVSIHFIWQVGMELAWDNHKQSIWNNILCHRKIPKKSSHEQQQIKIYIFFDWRTISHNY